MLKHEIRKYFTNKRTTLTDKQVEEASDNIFNQFFSKFDLKNVNFISGYSGWICPKLSDRN